MEEDEWAHGVVCSRHRVFRCRHKWDVEIQLDTPLQTIEGFGACFNELGWTSLRVASGARQARILRELFAPGVRRELQCLPHAGRRE